MDRKKQVNSWKDENKIIYIKQMDGRLDGYTNYMKKTDGWLDGQKKIYEQVDGGIPHT